ncbi:MAG: SDR family oxidoreductase [Bacillota bacterium]|nr:SDR family oxidoreductase [Bacillota bacterium]
MCKKVLITGASRGLGLCFTRKYLEDGGVVFACARDVQASGLVELKEKYGDALIPVEIDVVGTEAVNKAAKTVSQYTDKLDIIINNAAVHSATSFDILEETDLDDCLPVYDINAVGPLRVTKAFLPLITQSANGLIVNISSESGSISTAGRVKEFDYCMAKAALNMGTKLLHNYLKDRKVNVIAVHPGWMRTDMGGSNAHLDPYETACKLTELFKRIGKDIEGPVFIDNDGNEYPW